MSIPETLAGMDWAVGVPYFLGALSIAATLLPAWIWTRWWVRLCDFPRFQIALVALTIIVVLPAVRFPATLAEWLFLGVLIGVVFWQLTWVGPYFPGTARAVQSCKGTEPANERIALLTSNVLLTNRGANRFLEIIQKTSPDVVLAVEVDERLEHTTRAGSRLDTRTKFGTRSPMDMDLPSSRDWSLSNPKFGFFLIRQSLFDLD